MSFLLDLASVCEGRKKKMQAIIIDSLPPIILYFPTFFLNSLSVLKYSVIYYFLNVHTYKLPLFVEFVYITLIHWQSITIEKEGKKNAI